jgi:hypothetical protein
MNAGPRPGERSALREIDEETDVGEVYTNALLRSQLRPGLALLSVVLLGLGGLPILFDLLPELAGYRIGPVTLAWLILAVAVFPALFAAGWWQLRTAERVERDFTEILRRR